MTRFVALSVLVLGCVEDESVPPLDGDDLTVSDTTPEIPVDPDVDSYIPEGHAPVDPQRIVFLGDSITAGYGLSNPDNSYARLLLDNNDGKWSDWADADLADRYPDLVDVLDVSVSGATTSSLLTGQIPRVETNWGDSVQGETMVVMTIGGNDVSNSVFSGGNLDDAAADLLDNLDAIVAFFQDPVRFPDGTSIYITNVYEPTDGSGQVDECFFGLDLALVIPTFEQLAVDSRAMAEAGGWAWVDLRGHFLGHGFHHDDEGPWYDAEDPTLWFQDDCIHPNARGHHELRRLLMAAIDEQPLLLDDLDLE